MSGPQDGPIFVVGAPRSGTTLLRAMLDRHSRIAICDETFFHYWVARRARVFGDLADRARRERAVDRFLETQRVRRLGLDLAALRADLLERATGYPEFFRALIEFQARARGKPRGGEKTPQHALCARELLAWYPDARLVHLLRDPRDVAASLKRMPWGAGSRLLDTRLWRACVAGARACAGDPRFHELRYEDLVARPRAELERICAFLGEAFEPAMLEPSPGARSDRWWFDRAQGELERTRVERWREELTAAEIAVVEWVAGEELARGGYQALAPAAGTLARAAALVGALLAASRRRLGQLPALWYRWLAPDRLAAEEAILDRARARTA